jgi:hypothetical protein
LTEEQKRIATQKAELKKTGLTADEIKRVLDPIRSFQLQLQEDVQRYERLRRGEFEEIRNLRGLGSLLISLRIARSLSQRQLAELLGVHESQVSRDERVSRHHPGAGSPHSGCLGGRTAHCCGTVHMPRRRTGVKRRATFFNFRLCARRQNCPTVVLN